MLVCKPAKQNSPANLVAWQMVHPKCRDDAGLESDSDERCGNHVPLNPALTETQALTGHMAEPAEMRRTFGSRRQAPSSIPLPSRRSASLPAFASMPLAAAEAEQKQSADWLRSLLGAGFLTDLSQAFDWQLWCCGKDVASIPGNGLLRMGFERCPPPEGIRSSSCYRQTRWRSDGISERLALRGCELFYGQSESLCLMLPRYRFSPCLHECQQFPPLNWTCDRSVVIRAPQTDDERQWLLTLIVGLLNRISRYETEVNQLFGPSHRLACQKDWKKPIPLPMGETSTGWKQFADEVGKRLAQRVADLISEVADSEIECSVDKVSVRPVITPLGIRDVA